MPKHVFTTVDEYITSLPREVQAKMKQVRKAVQAAVPDAEECISYNMPAYRLGPAGYAFVSFAAYKQHWSLFGATEAVSKAFGNELAPYEGSGRGTLRFPLDEPVPVELVRRIAEFRASHVTR